MLHLRTCSLAAALQLAVTVSAASDVQLNRVSAADEGAARAAGLAVVERYPGFVLMSGSSEVSARAAATGLVQEVERHGYTLRLPYTEAGDPQEAWPWDRSGSVPLPRDLVLLQFVGPTRPEWIAALEGAGVPVLQYFHPYTYLVWNGEGALDDLVAGLDAVRWAGPWPRASRIADRLDQRSAGVTPVRVLRYKGAMSGRAEAFQALGASVAESSERDPVYVDTRLQIAGDRIGDLAAVPGVVSIQSVPVDGGLRGELSNQQFAGNVGTNNLPLPDYRAWLLPYNVTGNGVLIANVDGGVDTNHPNLINRFQACVGTTCGNAATDAHGTHTAGIMAADGSDNVRNSGNFVRGLGVAFGAKMVEQKYAPFFQQAGGMLLLMKDSTANGALVSGNSWGPAGSPRGYDADTRQVDVGVRDADSTVAGDQSLTYVLSIMNGNGGTSSQGTPDEAKNPITVGSTNSQSNANTANTSWRNISANSGHGPALDGRRIPHLVAPGCSVDSTVLSNGYGTMCGTSMASPHVTGAVALFAEGYQRLNRSRPSPALTRGAMIAAAADLSGFNDADGVTLGHRPDSKQGWGALRLGRLLDQLANALFYDQTTVFTATGNTWSVQLYPRNPAKPLSVVLSYTDAPGHGTCASASCTTPAWNNDLNLSVTAGANTFKGNVFNAQGFAATGGNADEKNNMEAVFFDVGQVSGAFSITVAAANINSDALPNATGSLQQDFALVCDNCTTSPNETLLADGFE